ncbi:phytoene/squalene synthase family protein [Sphingomonas parva]|uniref:Phytoene/squalene synthase family protein n=1 Tax=Sphingomonas parva TaxID=2555898 RepID=A0A4Y8ZYC1_9SPHN|nr:phytoene/squalene synthase family protein [Sphingomonas parva]TFI60335.1 phytoene/squalene synthase family protein [Sphingomonas parva]
MTRDALVAAAEQAIRQGSKSFRMASRLFDRTIRERAWLLYCWCRHCDDVCDGQELGRGGSVGPAAMADASALTETVLAGGTTGQLPFDALGAVLAECPIPHGYVRDHLAGFALDERGWSPRTEDDLLLYCYHVAGAVGCMMAVVMGVPPDDDETLVRACDLGIAFQLSNIARDIKEDHAAGRCYLPSDWLAEAGVERDRLLDPEHRATLVALAARLCILAERYEHSARAGIPRLPFRARWAVLAAAGIYGRIGRRVRALGPAAWDERVVVPKRTKAAVMLGALAGAATA